ncbi:hypothetical protein V8G54_025505 [Vigna mungo]|uniref:LapB rubredoxin metal binding domain-containing protein n=1 Tax=Vigna mungo TaxID=3915 RepID=A0AAQ3MZA5_VIGMU
MTRLIRTILVAHKLQLHYPKCIFRPLLSHYSATADSSDADLTHKPTNETTTTGWSRYGNIYAHPVVQPSDHSDGDEHPSGLRGNDAPMVKKKGKVKAQWVCSDCGHTTGRWWGTCPECDLTGTMQEFNESKLTDKSRGGLAITDDAVRSWLPRRPEELRLVKLEELVLDHVVIAEDDFLDGEFALLDFYKRCAVFGFLLRARERSLDLRLLNFKVGGKEIFTYLEPVGAFGTFTSIGAPQEGKER